MSVRSQNPFALLGEDGEESPAPAPKPKAAAAPAAAATQKPIVGARQPQKKQKNQADKREINADAPVPGESKEDRAATFGAPRGNGRGRGRGGRGSGNPRSNAGTYLGGDRPRRENGGGRVFDRQSQTGHKESDKNEAQGWGAEEGKQELEAEQLGEADAQADGAATPAPADGAATPARRVEEEEDNSQTYEEYLASQAERKLNLSLPKAREIEQDDEIKGQKVVKKGEQEEEDFLSATKKEAKAPKEKKTKQLLEVEFRHAPPRRDDDRAPRGGRGGARGAGGRGRGEGRGRGGRGGARRDGNNGGNTTSGSSSAVNLADESAFPTL